MRAATHRAAGIHVCSVAAHDAYARPTNGAAWHAAAMDALSRFLALLVQLPDWSCCLQCALVSVMHMVTGTLTSVWGHRRSDAWQTCHARAVRQGQVLTVEQEVATHRRSDARRHVMQRPPSLTHGDRHAEVGTACDQSDAMCKSLRATSPVPRTTGSWQAQCKRNPAARSSTRRMARAKLLTKDKQHARLVQAASLIPNITRLG